MGQELLAFPEVQEALAVARATPNDGQIYEIKWARELGKVPEPIYVIETLFKDMLSNRTRALHGSISGTVYVQSSNLRVVAVDVLSTGSVTHYPPSVSRLLTGSYGASILPNNSFGSRGYGGNLYVVYDIALPR